MDYSTESGSVRVNNNMAVRRLHEVLQMCGERAREAEGITAQLQRLDALRLVDMAGRTPLHEVSSDMVTFAVSNICSMLPKTGW